MKYVRLIITCILLLKGCFSESCFAQKPSFLVTEADGFYREANKLYDENKDTLALLLYQKARALYLRSESIVPNLIDVSLNMGIIYQTQERFAQSISAYKESLSFRKKQSSKIDSSYFRTFIYIGSAFTDLHQYDSAYTYFKKAESLVEVYPSMNGVLRLYNALGYLFDSFGNYTQSINYYTKALRILDYPHSSLTQPDEWELDRYVMYNNNIARSLRKLGRQKEAIEKTKSLLKYNIIRSRLYQNMAMGYLEINQPDSALAYLIHIKVDSIPVSAKIDYYNSVGEVYEHKHQYELALESFSVAQSTSLITFGNKTDRLATAYLGKGQVYEAKGDLPQALAQYQRAIQSLHFVFQSEDIYQNPSDLTKAVSSLRLFEALQRKAAAFRKYAERTHQLVDLEASLGTYQLAFQLADRIRKSYDSDEAKLFFANNVASVYEESIETAYQLFSRTQQARYLEEAFALAERSKAAVLAESLRELKLHQIPGIDSTLIQRERSLKHTLTALNLKLVDAKDSAQKVSCMDGIRETEIALAETIKKFEKNPQYYRLKYDTSSVSIVQLQASVLDEKTALVEYFLGKRALYAFVITQEGFQARQLPFSATFKRDWASLYQALYQAKEGVRYQGDESAFRLYQQVLAPLNDLVKEKQHLLIIPDGELNYLPFEALVTDRATRRYLIRDYSVGYAYSSTLLHQSRTQSASVDEHAKVRNGSLLAMAPFAERSKAQASSRMTLRSNTWETLPASADEVGEIGGEVFLRESATKERFMNQAGQYDIIHLATHAKADNTDPLHSYVVFYPGRADSLAGYRLYAQELYDMRLDHLKLVVLSACETGGGQLIRGEGVMSLARAFAYAGCPGIVTTFWKAEDQATAYITSRMHHYLRTGKAKDDALRLAKLDYLDEQDDPQRRAPQYWANFILIGDPTPLYFSYAWLWWALSGVILGALVGWYYRKKRLSGQVIPKGA